LSKDFVLKICVDSKALLSKKFRFVCVHLKNGPMCLVTTVGYFCTFDQRFVGNMKVHHWFKLPNEELGVDLQLNLHELWMFITLHD
jgi:hypothetical protein